MKLLLSALIFTLAIYALAASSALGYPINPVDFGAVADGSTDSTQAFNRAVNALPVNGVLACDGGVFLVGQVELKSDMTIRDCVLKVTPRAENPTSALDINGVSAPKRNIRIENVSVDGNRANQPAFNAGGEDGGHHCLRMVGSVSYVDVVRFRGAFCGSDGIEIFSASHIASSQISDLKFHHIRIKDSVLRFNRRIGISIDSAAFVEVANTDMSYNGLDMGYIQALYAGGAGAWDLTDWQPGSYTANCLASPNNGDCGLRVGSYVWGDGFRFESYGIGSRLVEVKLENNTATRNAGYGALFYETAAQNAAGFMSNDDISIIGGHYDCGEYPALITYNTSIAFTPVGGRDNWGTAFRRISVVGAIMSGGLRVKASDAVQASSNIITTPDATYYAAMIAATNVMLTANVVFGKIVYWA